MLVLWLVSLFHFVLFCMAFKGTQRHREFKIQSSLHLQHIPWAGLSPDGEKLTGLFS